MQKENYKKGFDRKVLEIRMRWAVVFIMTLSYWFSSKCHRMFLKCSKFNMVNVVWKRSLKARFVLFKLSDVKSSE